MPVFVGVHDSREDFTYGQSVAMAACAFSVRLINPNYSGDCMLVRRSSDSAELGVGFSSGWLDISAIESWAGSDSVYVKTWYDQSGNGNNVTQSAGAAQPRLYDAGVLETLNSNAAVYFNGSSWNLNRDANFVEGKYYAFCATTSCDSTSTSKWFTGTNPGGNNQGLQIGYNGSNSFKIAQWNNDATFTPSWTTSTPYVHAGKKNTPTGSTLWQNGTLISTQANPNATQITSATNFYVGAGGSPSYFQGHIVELVLWTYPISSSQLLIASADQKTGYGI